MCTGPFPYTHLTRGPQYLGPSTLQLAHLFMLVVTNSLTLFALTILLGRTIWSICLNMTTIEGWEVERHHAILRRARVLGGYLNGPDGAKVRIEHQEFPFDVGIWSNICIGMGTRNPLVWLWPFARSPRVEQTLDIQHNLIDGMLTSLPPMLTLNQLLTRHTQIHQSHGHHQTPTAFSAPLADR